MKEKSGFFHTVETPGQADMQHLLHLLFRVIPPFCTLMGSILFIIAHAQTPLEGPTDIEAMIQEMSLEEKLGQCFIIAAYCNSEMAKVDNNEEMSLQQTEEMIRSCYAGGVLFKQLWDPLSCMSLISYFQSIAKIPLFTALDMEWGLSMRMPGTIALPKNMTLGAIQDLSLIREYGAEVARQAENLGVNLVLAPVVDVNSNPQNPVINDRSFSSNPYLVSQKALAWLQGFKTKKLLACAKHFPGHGDTTIDSHIGLPTIQHHKTRLESVELMPFKMLIKCNIDAIMSAHIHVPSLGCKPNQPATLAKSVMTGLLREELAFQGLIISDDLMMDAIQSTYSITEACIQAFQAGCDLLICSKEAQKAYQDMLERFRSKELDEALLNSRVKRILIAKKNLSTKTYSIIPKDVWNATHQTSNPDLLENLYSEATTLVTLRKIALPLAPLVGKQPYCLDIGADENSLFYETLKETIPCEYYSLPLSFTRLQADTVLEKVINGSTIVLALHSSHRKVHNNYGISANITELIKTLRKKKCAVIAVVLTNPYAAQYLLDAHALIFGYENHPLAEKAAAKILSGSQTAKGKLPVFIPGITEIAD